ncbi:uncharacterized protein LOC121052442 [Rosa chinensis]|uniref:uncharacterized protein LOC121052442 n=1 Tax=Rosa chinensis TaxID=74649 RepID=UPI001AD8CB2E|nr:uncharacterized protein LOC121052442 [Rosa chinensis]
MLPHHQNEPKSIPNQQQTSARIPDDLSDETLFIFPSIRGPAQGFVHAPARNGSPLHFAQTSQRTHAVEFRSFSMRGHVVSRSSFRRADVSFMDAARNLDETINPKDTPISSSLPKYVPESNPDLHPLIVPIPDPVPVDATSSPVISVAVPDDDLAADEDLDPDLENEELEEDVDVVEEVSALERENYTFPYRSPKKRGRHDLELWMQNLLPLMSQNECALLELSWLFTTWIFVSSFVLKVFTFF